MINQQQHHHHHHFVPPYIIKRLPSASKKQEEMDRTFREHRNYLNDNPLQRDQHLAAIRKTIHNETRRLFDSQNTENYPVDPILTDVQVHSTLPSQNAALQLANLAYDFFHDKYQWESFDGRSSPIDLYINFGDHYDNAFYDGLRFCFGNGDGEYFNSFLLQDVFTHEMTHGVTDHKVKGLPYYGQQGALNEHISDVFAMCLNQRLKREKATTASWIVGEGLFTDKIKGKGIRSFKDELAYDDPVLGKDEQPKKFSDYIDTTEDNGGVHLNSGILNHFFYNLCILAETQVSDEWNNRSWKSPLSLYWESYPYIKSTTNFEQFAKITLRVAKENHPEIQTQVLESWRIVEINV